MCKIIILINKTFKIVQILILALFTQCTFSNTQIVMVPKFQFLWKLGLQKWQNLRLEKDCLDFVHRKGPPSTYTSKGMTLPLLRPLPMKLVTTWTWSTTSRIPSVIQRLQDLVPRMVQLVLASVGSWTISNQGLLRGLVAQDMTIPLCSMNTTTFKIGALKNT